ncbi:MAG: ABC transporter permease [Erysipelotrichaceae bacterium]|nr:ABC transporter permease [Erysipelotrichaceae bacterium]MBQ4253344.1 ABC transporter permease [Erysipelotrichaceae bacterium]
MKNDKIRRILKEIWRPLQQPVLASAVGLFVGAIIILLAGYDPLKAIAGLIRNGFFTKYAIASTLTRATPIIFAGLAAALAWGSGYSSMGAQGQMILGSLTSALLAANLKGPAWLVIIVSLGAGALVGGLFSFISAWISVRFDAYLLVITLMFNYVADYIASYLVNYVYLDPYAADRLAIQTQLIENATLPRLFPKYTVHLGFLIAIAATLLVWFIIRKTSFGYKARMTGLNASFARFGGVKAEKTMFLILILAGSLAGLGGGIEALGTRFRYIDKMITSPGYSWSGITASIMSNYSPIGVLFSSIFLAGITTGGNTTEIIMSIPAEITQIIQGVIIMLITARFVLKKKRKAAEKKAEGRVSAQ